jgi:hypothetical protein
MAELKRGIAGRAMNVVASTSDQPAALRLDVLQIAARLGQRQASVRIRRRERHEYQA